MLTFGEKLRLLRMEQGWTQPELAEKLKIEQSYLSKLENDRSIPSSSLLDSLIQVLSTNVENIFDGVDRGLIKSDFSHINQLVDYVNYHDQFLNRHKKRWLIASLSLFLIGILLLLLGYSQVIFSGTAYNYRCTAASISGRCGYDEKYVLYPFSYHYQGDTYIKTLGRGDRIFELYKEQKVSRLSNRVFIFLGIVVSCMGLIGVVLERRLHSMPFSSQLKDKY